MKELQRSFIFLNSQRFKNDQCCIQVFVKDGKGKLLKRIKERALFSDKNFCDICGLFIGLREAKKLGVKNVFILTDNTLLGKFINNGHGEDFVDLFGFYPDIKALISKFEKVNLRVVCWETHF